MADSKRGYGGYHQSLRAQWLTQVNAGGVSCWRCGELIAPHSDWHLGHDDWDRRKYRGPEHPACNLGAAALKKWRRHKEVRPKPNTRWRT